MKTTTFTPDYAVCPGETILESVEDLGITRKEYAQRIGISPKHFIDLCKGNSPITQEMALRLERVSGTPARIWLALETNYRQNLLRIQEKQDKEWLKNLPIAELKKREYLPKTNDRDILYERSLSFFGVAKVSIWEEMWQKPLCSFRKGSNFDDSNPLHVEKLAVWLRICELKAHQIVTAPFKKSKLENIVPELKKLTVLPPEEFLPRMKDLCSQAGIAFILEKAIPGISVSGAVKWLIPQQKAMLCLNLRGKYTDIFWFNFFHEIGHLLLDQNTNLFVDVPSSNPEKLVSEQEERANKFAAQTLISDDEMKLLLTLQSIREYKDFAQNLNIDISIIIGRLMHEGIINYGSPLYKLRKKISVDEV